MAQALADLPTAVGGGAHVARGSAVGLVFHGLSVALQLAQLAILSRLLTADDFGVVGMAMAVTGFVRLFQDAGLMSATIQRQSLTQDLVSALFWINAAIGTGLMLLCWALAPVAGWVFSDDRVGPVIAALAVTILMVSLRGQHRALVNRRMEIGKLNRVQLLSSFAGLVVACLLAWQTDAGYWSVVAGQMVTGLVDMILFWRASSWRPGIPRSRAGVRSAFDFGINILGSNILGWVWKQSDNALIGWRWGSVELGHYARAYSLLLMPLMLIGGPVASAVIPVLSRLQDEPARWQALFRRIARVLALVVGLLSLILIIDAPHLIRLMLGPGWDQAAVIFGVLAFSILPSMAWEISRFVFLSLGRSDVMLRYSLVAGPLHLAAFAIGLAHGPVGVAWGLVVVSWLLVLPILVVSARTADISVSALLLDVVPAFAAFGGGLLLAWWIVPMLPVVPLLAAILLKALITSGLFALVFTPCALLVPGWRLDVVALLGWLRRRLAGAPA